MSRMNIAGVYGFDRVCPDCGNQIGDHTLNGCPTKADQVMVAICGRDVLCDILWSEDDGRHIVVRNDKGRELIAKRSLGAWIEITLQTVAARLNRAI